MHMRDQGFLGTKLGCCPRKGEMLISPPNLGVWSMVPAQHPGVSTRGRTCVCRSVGPCTGYAAMDWGVPDSLSFFESPTVLKGEGVPQRYILSVCMK